MILISTTVITMKRNTLSSIKLKFTLQPAMKPEVEKRYSYTLSLTLVLDMGWVVIGTPQPFYSWK
jgi:hypothetical protein